MVQNIDDDSDGPTIVYILAFEIVPWCWSAQSQFTDGQEDGKGGEWPHIEEN